ncbi:MAG: hypothetical protein V4510_13445 [bacterium]
MGRRHGGWVSFQRDNERAERVAAGGEGDRDCARAERCATATREKQGDGKTRRVPARCYQPLCHADREILIGCLNAMPAAHDRLGAAIGDHVVSETMIRVPFGPSVPLRTDVDLIARLLVDAALSWLERIAQVAGLYCPRTEQWRRGSLNGKAGSLLARSAPVLASHADAVLALPLGPMLRPSCSPSARIATRRDAERGDGEALVIATVTDTTLLMAGGEIAALEFLELDYLARSALGETNPDLDQLLGVDCESCGKRSLRRALPPMHDGERAYYAMCGECGHLMTDDEFKTWTDRMVRFYRHRVTPAILASAGLRGTETPAILTTVT